jgi:hypothetical protein
MSGSPRRFCLPWFGEERKTWSRLLYRLRGVRCLPTGCHKCANTSKAFPPTHPSAFVANRGRKAVCCSIERPRDHPMRSYGNRGTGFIRRIRVVSLCGAAQHVNHSGHCVRRLRLSLHRIHYPSHSHGVHAHRRVADFVFISRRNLDEMVRTRPVLSCVSSNFPILCG